MSSKFNNNQNLQPTPKICRAGPEGWRWFDYLFLIYPLQAYASWYDPFTPIHRSITGTAILQPFETLNLHFGIVEAGRHAIEIDLIYIPATEQFSLILQLTLDGHVIDSRSEFWNEPAPILPWATDLIIWTNPPNPTIVTCKIYS